MQVIETRSAISHCVNSTWKRAWTCRKTMNGWTNKRMIDWLNYGTRSYAAFGIYRVRTSCLQSDSSETLVSCFGLSRAAPSYRICPSWCPRAWRPLQDVTTDVGFLCDEAAVVGDMIKGTSLVPLCTSLGSPWHRALIMVMTFASS